MRFVIPYEMAENTILGNNRQDFLGVYSSAENLPSISTRPDYRLILGGSS